MVTEAIRYASTSAGFGQLYVPQDDLDVSRSNHGVFPFLYDSRSDAPRFEKFLSRVAPLVIKYTELDDDALRENALQALEAFIPRFPKEITPHIDPVIDLGLKFLRYDPNYDDE
jgi:hypothetical protein